MRSVLVVASVSLSLLASAAAADLPIRWKAAQTTAHSAGFQLNLPRSFGPEPLVPAAHHVRKHFRHARHATAPRAAKSSAKSETRRAA